MKKKLCILKDKITLYFKVYRYLLLLAPYFENGFYSLCKNGKSFYIKKGARPMFLLFCARKKDSVVSAARLLITYTERKFIFFAGDRCFAFYDKKSNWKKCFSNMQAFASKISYPVNTYIELNAKHRLKIDRFISSAKQLSNKSYCTLLLELGARAEKIADYHDDRYPPFADKPNTLSYIQHGDANIGNALTVNGNPVFIDLDDINIYPALFDYFRFIITEKPLLQDFIAGKHDREIARVLNISTTNKDELNAQKDYYFSLFICIFPNSIGELINCFPKNYEKTLKAYHYKLSGENNEF